MSMKTVQLRRITASLITSAFLFATVQAKSNEVTSSQQRPVSAAHQQCGVHSPLFLSLGDAYFDLDSANGATVTTASDLEKNRLLDRLSEQRFQDGWGFRVDCIEGHNQTSEQLSSIALEQITADRSNSSSFGNEINITAFEYDAVLRRLKRETVTIPTDSSKVLHLTENTLVSSSRHRQATPIGSYLEETRTDASMSEASITIEQSVFVNGTLAQWYTWHLPN